MISGNFYANKLREDLKLTSPPFLPVQAFNKLDIVYKECKLDGCLGMTIRLSETNQVGVMVSSKILEPGKVNFTASHELGHATIPSHANKDIYKCAPKDFNLWNEKKLDSKEIEANQFAAEWLMPEKYFKPAIVKKEPNFDLITELCNLFKVSLTAAAIRYVDLTDYNVSLIASEERIMKYFRSSKDFPYFIDWGIVPDTYVRNLQKGLSLPNEFLPVSSDNWFDGKQPESGEILEYSKKLGNYSTVLTMLWEEE